MFTTRHLSASFSFGLQQLCSVSLPVSLAMYISSTAKHFEFCSGTSRGNMTCTENEIETNISPLAHWPAGCLCSCNLKLIHPKDTSQPIASKQGWKKYIPGKGCLLENTILRFHVIVLGLVCGALPSTGNAGQMRPLQIQALR